MFLNSVFLTSLDDYRTLSPSGIGIISVSRHPERSNQDLSSEPKAGDNVTVAERA